MALRELVTILRYELEEGKLKKYVDGYQRAEKLAQNVSKEITKAANTAAGRLNNGLRQAARQTSVLERGTRSIQNGLQRMVRNARDFGRSLGQGVRQGVREALRELERLRERTRNGSGRGGGGGSLAGVVSTIVGLISARQFMDASDSWAGTSARIGLATTDEATRSRSERYLFGRANDSGQDYESFAETFLSLARGRKSLGLENDSTLVLAETVGKLMTIGGGSTQAQQAALTQFGQAMNVGVLRGEDLNSVMSQAPRLAQAIADALGVGVGNLRELGEQGDISAKKIATGLLRQVEQIDEEFARLPMTFSRSFVRIGNEFSKLAGKWNKQYKLAERFSKLALIVVENLDKVVIIVGALATAAAAVTGLAAAGVAMKVVASAFGAIATAASLLAPIGTLIASTFAAIGAVGVGALLTVGAAIVAVGLLIYKYWDPIKAFFLGMWDSIKAGGEGLWRSLQQAIAPLLPAFDTIGSALKSILDWFVKLIAPVELTSKELENAGIYGKLFGAWIINSIQQAIDVIGFLIDRFVALGTWIGETAGWIVVSFERAWDGLKRGVSAVWDWITSKFRAGWDRVTGMVPDWMKRGFDASVSGTWLDVGAGQMVSAGGARSVSQTINNSPVANVTVTPPPGSNPAAYGAATQRGTKRALGSIPFQMPTPVEDL